MFQAVRRFFGRHPAEFDTAADRGLPGLGSNLPGAGTGERDKTIRPAFVDPPPSPITNEEIMLLQYADALVCVWRNPKRVGDDRLKRAEEAIRGGMESLVLQIRATGKSRSSTVAVLLGDMVQ